MNSKGSSIQNLAGNSALSNFGSSQIDHAAKSDQLQNLIAGAEGYHKQAKRLKKLSQSMRRSNFSLGDNKFYDETSNKYDKKTVNVNVPVKKNIFSGNNHGFTLGSAKNDFVSVSNHDYSFDNIKEVPNTSKSNSKQKCMQFRKHSYVVGYKKPNYESMSRATFKNLKSNITSHLEADLIMKENKKSNINMKPLRRMNMSYDITNQERFKNDKLGRSKDAEKNQRFHQRNNSMGGGNKGVQDLMKHQNIVYGYERGIA